MNVHVRVCVRVCTRMHPGVQGARKASPPHQVQRMLNPPFRPPRAPARPSCPGLHPPAATLHATTLGVPGAWASMHHFALNWCNQLVQPLSR